MTRSIIITLTAMFFHLHVNAQSTEDTVKAVINRFFEAMKNGDAEAVRQSFADSAILQTLARDGNGNIRVKTDNIAAFAEFVRKQAKGAADERIQFETIRIDGSLAIAWTPYRFYYNNAFSHCGVNSFQLVRLSGGWKIQYLIDTRRKAPCD